jgi:hypothetical protein
MKSNLNRLAVTFKRPILGIHNKTNGILFDVIECLIQRNLGYATYDVRVCYSIIKAKLYNPAYSKVVFVLHSQGGIEGSLIIDWLLQELPQDLLAKLEVYTFGNAANHFNNPHRHLGSQDRALGRDSRPDAPNGGRSLVGQPQHPFAAATSSSPPQSSPSVPESPSDTIYLRRETSAAAPSAVSDRAIGHIEHYAHTTDFVALWGVLHFAFARPGAVTVPRFIGRVFAKSGTGGGHQMVQHYLDGMFPLARGEKGELIGCLDEETKYFGDDGSGKRRNEFMESEVVVGEPEEGRGAAAAAAAREATGASWTGNGSSSTAGVEVHGSSPVDATGRFRSRGGVGVLPPVRRAGSTGVKMKVKDLSRLWLYRNGKSPSETPPSLVKDADGVVRMATM